MKVGLAIKEYRLKQGFNQGDFAKKIGITQANLCRIEKNQTSPAEETLERISSELGLPKEFLVFKNADMSDRKDIPDHIKLVISSLVKLGEDVFLDDKEPK